MELEDKIDALTKRKQSFERNRNLCAIVAAVIIYNMWQAYDLDNPEWWFWLLMGGLVAIAIGIGVYDFIKIKKIKAELEPLLAEFNKSQEQEEDTEVTYKIEEND